MPRKKTTHEDLNIEARKALDLSGASQDLPTDVGSRLVSGLEIAYDQIRVEHIEVPPAVIVISSSATKYGHYAVGRWQLGQHGTEDARLMSEIMMGAEGLRREPRQVLATLIHEAAHGLAHARGIKDTSRDGKYHNKRFRDLAEELGLQVESDKTRGHTKTSLPENEFPELVDMLTPKLVAWRNFEQVTKSTTDRDKRVSLNCRCPRNIQVRKSVEAQGLILCGKCGDAFE